MSRKNIFLKRTIALFVLAGLLLEAVPCQVLKAKEKVEISRTKMVMMVGEKKQLKIKNADKKVIWSSTRKEVAAVNKNGVVKAKEEGETKIVARLGNKKFSCKLTVKSNQQDVVTPSPDWETGKTSGTEADYQEYFAVNMKKYLVMKKNTTPGTIESVTYYSKVVGADRKAYVYLPPGYDTSIKYPVLYMIHGIGCDRGQWYSMQLNNILSNMICRGEVAPFVAVLPSVIPKNGLAKQTLGAENIGAFTLFEEEFCQDLEPYILSNFSVSSDRKDTGVCGLSMGGMEALHLGFSLKDHFNYIGSFSAAPTLNQDILNLDGWTAAPELVLICTGTADGTVGDNPYNYHKTLENNQVDHIWYQYPGGGHDGRVWQDGLVNFLKRSFTV